jgi:Domain of unknown function (4846)
MRRKLLMTIILPQLLSPRSYDQNVVPFRDTTGFRIESHVREQTIQNIPLPSGYARIHFDPTSFPAWLRSIRLRNDRRVFLYNGELKTNQSAQFAVLDIPVGQKDLQQCADAIMRLRAQYLLDNKKFTEISFADNSGRKYDYATFPGLAFEKYLEKVFSCCGTISLEKQLKRVTDFYQMQPGDILIKGGSPGHAIIVVDMAVNRDGKKIYLLAQSFMPAQDIHILKNPENKELNPWYALDANSLIYTPEWVFEPKHLRRW